MTLDDVIKMLNSEVCELTTGICLMRYKEEDCWKCILKEYSKTVYNKAIDDLVEKVELKYLGVHPDELYEKYYPREICKQVKELAKQLKAGVTNE